ncbi:hypothetical protein J3E07_001587 [Methanococcus voltae]|uniref:Uncharacterized protein n=1 Tax=Methanococcus voltae TaxID=2188 RepID=A0A8J7RNH5_METVO|nr:hypothetical protein [Methanococcus voltae]MBP2202146.1 hypothetical protein [Methanococcus voltae]
MNLFLDSCVIIGQHINLDPQNKLVKEFLKEYNLTAYNDATTCKKVKNEVLIKSKNILKKYEKEGKISKEDIITIYGAINNYLNKVINMVDYTDITNHLYNKVYVSLLIDLTDNDSDVEIFSNFILWTLNHNSVPLNPTFLTTDANDYDRYDTEGNSIALKSAYECLKKYDEEFKSLPRLVILKSGTDNKCYDCSNILSKIIT